MIILKFQGKLIGAEEEFEPVSGYIDDDSSPDEPAFWVGVITLPRYCPSVDGKQFKLVVDDGSEYQIVLNKLKTARWSNPFKVDSPWIFSLVLEDDSSAAPGWH